MVNDETVCIFYWRHGWGSDVTYSFTALVSGSYRKSNKKKVKNEKHKAPSHWQPVFDKRTRGLATAIITRLFTMQKSTDCNLR